MKNTIIFYTVINGLFITMVSYIMLNLFELQAAVYLIGISAALLNMFLLGETLPYDYKCIKKTKKVNWINVDDDKSEE